MIEVYIERSPKPITFKTMEQARYLLDIYDDRGIKYEVKEVT